MQIKFTTILGILGVDIMLVAAALYGTSYDGGDLSELHPTEIAQIIEQYEVQDETFKCRIIDIPSSQEDLEYLKKVYEDQYFDVEMLAHIINAECGGADYCSDVMCYYTGSVVLNRVSSGYFPDTLEEVIFQPGQYQPTWTGTYFYTPNERSWRIALELIAYGSNLPENVLFQANFIQGDGIYEQVDNMYFCYKE